jgi:hypothetical protein
MNNVFEYLLTWINKYTKKYNHAIVTFYLEITNGKKSINQ